MMCRKGVGMSASIKKASELITSLFENLSCEDLKNAQNFTRSWKAAVGDKIASHSKIIDVNKGTIIVEVDHPGWSQHLLLMKQRLLRELAATFPELEIANLAIRIKQHCPTPYVRQDGIVGEGVFREDATTEEADVPIREDFDSDLKDVLARLKSSIKKGKPS